MCTQCLIIKRLDQCLWLIERSRALGPGCAVSPRHRLMIRSRLIQCLLSKNNKTRVSTGHFTHVYALVLTLVLVLLNQRPGWSPRTGAHLHHRRIPVRERSRVQSFPVGPLQATGDSMSQRFTVTAGDIQGEVNQLFEGDEETPSASDAAAAEASGRGERFLTRDTCEE